MCSSDLFPSHDMQRVLIDRALEFELKFVMLPIDRAESLEVVWKYLSNRLTGEESE